MGKRTRFYYRDPTAPEPIGLRKLGVIALIERDGSLLLERRTDAPLWSLIAGGVEDAESLADALRREVFEETGLTVAGYDLFGPARGSPGPRRPGDAAARAGATAVRRPCTASRVAPRCPHP